MLHPCLPCEIPKRLLLLSCGWREDDQVAPTYTVSLLVVGIALQRCTRCYLTSLFRARGRRDQSRASLALGTAWVLLLVQLLATMLVTVGHAR